MFKQIRLLIGISVFWLALSVLTDGITTLLLPVQISDLLDESRRATVLGLLTFIAPLAAALIQPVAGAFSDRWKPMLGRRGFIGIGLLHILLSIASFAVFKNLAGLAISYLLILVAASIAQAGQQGLIPDLIDHRQRGMASGLKGFMDMIGAMLGFVILGQLLGTNRTSAALVAIAAILAFTYLLSVILTSEDRPAPASKAQRRGTSVFDLFRLDLTEHASFKRVLIARFLFLFGVYAIGRFLLLFVARRLGLNPNDAAEQTGTLLAALALVTVLASLITGWLADRIGRMPLMLAGALLGGISALLLIWATSAGLILLFGSLMSLGSAAFASGSWARLADIVPKEESARYFGLANFSTAGPIAAVGLLGPLIDSVEALSPGNGYPALFLISALAFFCSLLPLKNEIRKIGVQDESKRKDRAYPAGLAVISVQTDPAHVEEDQDPAGGTAKL